MWNAYRIDMKLAQPLSVGPGWRLGFVMLTRLDVPPRTLWGAFTDALTRWKKTGGDGGCGPELSLTPGENPFVEVGEWVERHVRFLPGVITLKSGDDIRERVIPWYEFGEGKCFRVIRRNGGSGFETEFKVRKRYVDSRGSAALDYTAMAAEKGMLFETERILPRIKRDGELLAVHLEVILFLKDEALPLKEWLNGAAGRKYIRVGRDAGAGDGCFESITLREIAKERIAPERGLRGETLTWLLGSNSGPILNAAGGESSLLRIPGPFLYVEEANALAGYWGELRPHLVREFKVQKNVGFGRRIGYAGDAPSWILEHGGVLALKDDVSSASFRLGKEGWYLHEIEEEN